MEKFRLVFMSEAYRMVEEFDKLTNLFWPLNDILHTSKKGLNGQSWKGTPSDY